MARIPWRHEFWNGKRKEILIPIIAAGLMLVLIFLLNFLYIFGSLFNSGSRTHALKILAVDYDGGVIGQSLLAAYTQFQSDAFPDLQFSPASKYPDIQSIRDAVCRGDFWGAVVAQPGASDRLSAALGGGLAAANYESNNTLTYIHNGARYPTIQLGSISGNLATLIGAAGSAYHALNGTNAIQIVDASDPAAVSAFTNPIRSSSIDLMATNQGTRVLYNTVSIVLPIIQQFFFLMAMNGISSSHGVFGRLKTSQIWLMRFAISVVYTFLGSLVVTGVFWAYKEDWGVSGSQFILTWLIWWFYAHINFNIMDTATAFIPPAFISFFVLTCVILNVTSTIYPFELMPGFFRWSYALPAHEIYLIFIQIWSGGCNNQLSIALPILFAWEMVSTATAITGMFYRNRNALQEIERSEEDMNNDAMSRKDLVSAHGGPATGQAFSMPTLGDGKRSSSLRGDETV
ncbi:nitrosoguanidine resistance protein [Phlyctema vagabunda]|uniref:Nitrosoguanidine resistance protein n=1 Tax=Phlyctema vagabunda TaxID=108571 RepID=A0ABR4PE94_9HELO